MSGTRSQDMEFRKEMTEIIPSDILDTAIAWINKNMNPDQVFDDKKLEEWAEENNYEKTNQQ